MAVVERRGFLKLLGLGAVAAVAPADAPAQGTKLLVSDEWWVAQGTFTLPRAGVYSISGEVELNEGGRLNLLVNGETRGVSMVTDWENKVQRLRVVHFFNALGGEKVELRSTSLVTGELQIRTISA